MTTIAVIGDIHGDFTQDDVDHLNTSDVDQVLVVGDLERIGISPLASEACVATTLAKLSKPALVIPGNHDGVRLPQLVAEALGLTRTAATIGVGHSRRLDDLERRLHPAVLCGYSLHDVRTSNSHSQSTHIGVIACRPYSMGGPSLSFPNLVARRHGVRTIDESADRLCQLVDQCEAERILFLAHNGPTGFGSRKDDIWGRDFGSGVGDHGDPDLEIAIAHAKARGRNVLAVIGGHMHHAVKGGGTRPWHIERDGTHYINAAKVPRIFRHPRRGHSVHHSIHLTVGENDIGVEEHLVSMGQESPQ
jgi:uncharacterized protein (TIGR04168 family)